MAKVQNWGRAHHRHREDVTVSDTVGRDRWTVVVTLHRDKRDGGPSEELRIEMSPEEARMLAGNINAALVQVDAWKKES